MGNLTKGTLKAKRSLDEMSNSAEDACRRHILDCINHCRDEYAKVHGDKLDDIDSDVSLIMRDYINQFDKYRTSTMRKYIEES